MVEVNLESSTLAVLVAGLYCTYNNVESIAIPESVFMSIGEKLEYFLPFWDYEVISFEDWIKTCLLIIPKVLLTEEDIEEMRKTSLCWEYPNGNMILHISMNIEPINRCNDG